MGRGLSAILSVSAEEARPSADELRELPVELVSPGRRQPRRRFDEERLRALAASLGDQGVLQPVLVRPKAGGTYELVAGERRWRAAQQAGDFGKYGQALQALQDAITEYQKAQQAAAPSPTPSGSASPSPAPSVPG